MQSGRQLDVGIDEIDMESGCAESQSINRHIIVITIRRKWITHTGKGGWGSPGQQKCNWWDLLEFVRRCLL